MTYSSRNCLISRGLRSLKLGERPVSFLLFFSSWRIWLACVTHLSQMWAWIPEIIRSTSFLLRPQKEQVTSAIKCVLVQRPSSKCTNFRPFWFAARRPDLLLVLQNFVDYAVFLGFRGPHPVIPV